MEESAVGSVVVATIEAVLRRLLSFPVDEISPFSDLVKLKDCFLIIQGFLYDVEKQHVKNNAIKYWLKKLEDVAFDADDVLDELNCQLHYKKMKTKVQVSFSSSNPISLNEKMARKIRNIYEDLKMIKQEAKDFGLQRNVGPHAPTVGSDAFQDRETDSFSIDPVFVGRESDVSEIVELLAYNEYHERVLSIIPIVGMGGLGKTTLAREVFHDERIKNRFDMRIWVCVSQKFDDKAIFQKILESVTKQKVDLETKDAILQNLQRVLTGKRYLLVLDDVWTEETKKLNDFIDTLSGIGIVHNSCAIVTTRSEKVASIVRPVGIFKLNKLSEENCWSIIKKKVFGEEYIPLEFETIGKGIAKRCQGLPLAAKVIGGLLCGKSKDEWHSVAETQFSNLGEYVNVVVKSLKLSFDYLPLQSMKKCFAYCSIFPKGYDIERRMLINLWMAEGFIQSDQINDMEIAGNKYFDYLLQNSLLQAAERDVSNKIVTCNMHELVHDLASSILNGTGSIRYIFLDSIAKISKEKARNLRSLIFKGRVSKDMFSDFKCLRGLVLVDGDIKELPKIEDLIHLRYLDIPSAKIRCLPKSPYQSIDDERKGITNEEIPKLRHLPHLKSLYLHSIPNVRSIGSLVDGIHDGGDGKDTTIVFPALERLMLSKMPNLTELLTASETQLREVVAFPCLEYLDVSNCKKWTSVPSHFPCLKELKIYCLDKSLVLENLFVNLTSLMKLDIFGVVGLVCLPNELFRNNPILSYLRIRCCPNLTHLVPCLRGGGAALKELRILNCPNLSKLPDDLQCLGSLEKLEIGRCKNLESVTYESVQGFTSLHSLNIYHCNGLRELPEEMLVSSMLSLEFLSLVGLSSLTNLAIVIDCLQKMPRLATLGLSIFPELTNNSFLPPTSLRGLWVSGPDDCVSLPYQFQFLFALTSLRLYDLGIEFLPEWLGELSCLEDLYLVGCKKLRRLPSRKAMQRLTELTTLEIKNCPLLELERYIIAREIDDDPEWLKISHIPRVSVDGRRVSYQGLELLLPIKRTPSEAPFLLSPSPEDSEDQEAEMMHFPSGSSVRLKELERNDAGSDQQSTAEITEEGINPETKMPSSSMEQAMQPRCNIVSVAENEHYVVTVKDNHIQLELDHQIILIGDHPSPGPFQISPVTSVINLAEQDLDELPERPEYTNPLVLFLQRNNRLTHFPPSFFDHMPNLCFLDLSSTRIMELPSSLFKRTKLQVLLLRSCVCLDSLPAEVKNLSKMEVLDLSGTELYALPEEIGQLTRLGRLNLSFYGPDNESEYAHLPSELVSESIISELRELQALSILVHPEDHRWTKIAQGIIKDVARLKKLTYLQFYFPTLQAFECFIEKSPSWEKQGLSEFKFIVGHNVKRIISRVPNEVETKYDEQVKCLRFVNGHQVPDVVKTVLIHATAFYLDHHLEIQSLSEFGISNFDELKFCLVRECPKIQFMIRKRSKCAIFPNLEHLGVHYLWKLKKLIHQGPLPSGSFHSLKHLMVDKCPKLEFILSKYMLECLANLEEFVAQDCESLKTIIKEEKKKVNYDKANLLPRLQKLELRHLPRLVTLGDGLLSLSKEKISHYCCPKFDRKYSLQRLEKRK